MNIKTTADGHAIIKDEDGWWCYAAFEPDGGRKSSGIHVGHRTTHDILNASRNIPYHQLNAIAHKYRRVNILNVSKMPTKLDSKDGVGYV